MANLIMHILASTFMFLLGLWHLISSLKAYLKNPNNYSAKIWYPITPKFKALEIYLQLAAILLGIFYYLVISTDFDPVITGSTPVYRLTTLQTATVLFFFLVLVMTVLVSENTSLLAGLPPGTPFIIAALGFGLQWWVLDSGSALTSGIEGKCETLLGKTAAICCAFSIALGFQSKMFMADLGLNSAILLQGLWFFQSGLSVHVEGFMPEGCHPLLDVPGGVEGSTQCVLENSRLRAFALLDLFFVAYVIVVVVIVVIVSGFVGSVLGVRKHGGGYEPLSNSVNHVEMFAKVQP